IVCSDTVGHQEAIWQCPECYSLYHLKCVKSWAQVCLQKKIAEALKNKQSASSVSRNWTCKNCLKEFTSVPDRYFCYCGKEENPEFDPWLPPHSCGNICGRILPCGHTCNERCHAGRCPPCPRIVTVTCPCGKTKQTVRCSMQHLESAIACCSLPCLKRLPCGRHLCKAKCHSGPCPPCSAVIHQKCFCGSAERDVPCSEAEGPSYSCGRICGRPLACGHHTCPLPCHDGPCPPCPNQPPRTCFCGKKQYTISCEEPTPSCHQICDKLLPCGHRCPALCHPPPCPPCMLVVRKTCRCGRKTAEVPCSQSLECNVKCQELRDCGRHRCGRRCCDGHHSVCTAVCNKPLSCGRHVCLLPCHAGECPPCPLKVTIRCECGATTMEVPCKDFRRSLYPPCPQPCRKPSHCHHEHIQEHCCHPGSCPECILPCGKLLPCGHMCKAICHGDSACPPCHEMVEKRCEGGHTLVRVRCCDRDSPAFCDQPCGRLLACEHHHCSLPCHGPETPCEVCRRKCPGRATCSHPCPRVFCHPGVCDPCTQMVKKPCFCGKSSRQFRCCDVCEEE
ncbi:hypothetical protein WA588_000378, partial [Blastocystis sp. NMH]